jgi:transposase
MTMPSDDAMTKVSPVRRVEVFTGAGHRRKWTDEAKALVVAESYAGVETVCEVARRHGLAPTQLFTWRRLAKAVTPRFVPVLVEPSTVAPAAGVAKKRRRRSRDGGIELEIDGVVVRVSRGAEAKTVAAVIQELKAAQ